MALFDVEQKIYDGLRAICMETKQKKEKMPVIAMLEKLMDMEGMFIHCPYHHFLLPAALLTQIAIAEDKSDEELSKWLNEAENRGKNVPPGSCGFNGACGAGVGIGITVSIYSGSSHMATEEWALSNRATGKSLLHISEYPGPRCCKRTCFLAVEEGIPFMKENLGVELELEKNIVCKYYESNPDCIEGKCPFYKTEEEDIKDACPIVCEDEKMPRKDPKRTCKCMSEPVKLQTKKGTLTWLKEVGDAVEEGELICEGEVDKKIVEFFAPCSGKLIEQCVKTREVFTAGTVLGYIK